MGARRLCSVLGAPAAEAFVCVAPLPPGDNGAHDALRRRAACLHERHRVPFVLSRLAASAALSALLRIPVVFSGSRLDAQRHGAALSLAHEDRVGAAVAWRKDAPFAVGVDIVDVSALARLVQRFPHFAARMLPHCTPELLSPADSESISLAYGADAASVVLAQHWGLRECCVKLIGAPGRSFSMRCVEGPAAVLPPEGFVSVKGEEREAFCAAGMRQELCVTTRPLTVDMEGSERKAYVVVIAACEKEVVL